jgi:uncharacterized iron-regulated membrane protein
MIIIAIGLSVLSISAIISYIYRRNPGLLAIPEVPENISFGLPIIFLIIVMGMVLPLFGLSVALIYLFSKFSTRAMLKG